MANYQYIRGRSFEYQRARHYRELGAMVLRTAGSHGAFDLIIVWPAGHIILLQCKRTAKRTEATRLCREFRSRPPLPAGQYEQRLEVLVKGGELLTVIEYPIPRALMQQPIEFDVSGNSTDGI